MTEPVSARFILHTDGAAKGNPGPSGIGIVLYRDSDRTEPVAAFGEYIGETTNNVAEYKALIRGLSEALIRGADQLEARTDSELMARQIAGRYKVSAPQITPLYQEACQLLSRFEKATVVHVLREKNALADKLANQGVAAGRPSRPTPEADTSLRRATPPPESSVSPAGSTEAFHAAVAGLAVTKRPLSSFDALLDTDRWFGGQGATIRGVADQARRIYEADLSRPVVLAADGTVIEGAHRIARAYLLGQSEIETVQFEKDPPPEARSPLS
ncbi:MAG: ribonuclease HI family protein [Cytophagales bacterium]|nr:ribonuclease HI family protein [Armatimonadota bacterium]